MAFLSRLGSAGIAQREARTASVSTYVRVAVDVTTTGGSALFTAKLSRESGQAQTKKSTRTQRTRHTDLFTRRARRPEADVAGEIKGESLDDKLAKIKAKTANASAKAQLAELKRQSAAKKEAAAAAAQVKKTM